MMWYGMTDDSMSFVLLVPVWMIACCAACFDSPPLLVHDAETAAAATSPLPLPPQPPSRRRWAGGSGVVRALRGPARSSSYGDVEQSCKVMAVTQMSDFSDFSARLWPRPSS